MELIKAIIYYINSLTVNIIKPYFVLTWRVLISPKSLAAELRKGSRIEFEPAKYLIQAVLIITGIWSFGYLLTTNMAKSQSWTFNLLIGVYFLSVPFVFSLIIRALKISLNPMVLIRSVYYCIVGAFAPPILFLVEINRTISHYIGDHYNHLEIENYIIASLGLIGIVYFFIFLKESLNISKSKFALLIIPLALLVNVSITELFKYFIDVLKANGIM